MTSALSEGAALFIPGAPSHNLRIISPQKADNSDAFSLRQLLGTQAANALDNLTVATANVRTLHPGELRSSSSKAVGSTARMEELDSLFALAGVRIIGMQETRIQSDGAMHLPNYRVYSSSATPSGESGIQIWISHCLTFLVTAVQPVSSRILHLSLQIAASMVHVVAAHAPINDATADVKTEFWDELDRVLRPLVGPRSTIILAIDGNARLGTVLTKAAGPCEPDKETENGTALRSMADEHDLKLLNTWVSAGTTWTSPRGPSARIDYIGLSSTAAELVNSCWIPSDIDLATKLQDDHRPVCARLTGLLEHCHAQMPSSEDTMRYPRKPCPSQGLPQSRSRIRRGSGCFNNDCVQNAIGFVTLRVPLPHWLLRGLCSILVPTGLPSVRSRLRFEPLIWCRVFLRRVGCLGLRGH